LKLNFNVMSITMSVSIGLSVFLSVCVCHNLGATHPNFIDFSVPVASCGGGSILFWWRIPRRRHRHPRRHPREDRCDNVGVSFSLPQEELLREIARVGRCFFSHNGPNAAGNAIWYKLSYSPSWLHGFDTPRRVLKVTYQGSGPSDQERSLMYTIAL